MSSSESGELFENVSGNIEKIGAMSEIHSMVLLTGLLKLSDSGKQNLCAVEKVLCFVACSVKSVTGVFGSKWESDLYNNC